MSQSNVKLFEKEEFGKVRVVMQGEDPWFVAKDVCGCLEIGNSRDAVASLDDDEKGVGIIDTPGGKQEMSIVSEPGLYSLILRSRKPEAKAFKRWVTHEVIPSIRKHGLYATEEVVDRILDDPDFGITLLQRYKFEREQRQLAEAQRDEAIRTKAEIGSRREATAMNTASVLSKQNDKLRTEIGDSRTWKQVKALPWFLEVFIDVPAAYSVAGRKLSELSRRLGYEIREVEDTRYGIVKAYHADVITAFRVALRDDLNMMRKYRR